MAHSHPQAYLSASQVIAASPSLDPASLAVPNPGGDALLVLEYDGLGLVAARTDGDFTHVVCGVDRAGIELWESTLWRVEADADPPDLPALEPGPLDLERALTMLADAPPGVHAELLDAALAGPIAFIEEDSERRAAWIAWLSATVPGRLTFATFTSRPLDVHVCATTPEHATAFANPIHTSRPSIMAPSHFAHVAAEVAARNPAALRAVEGTDPVAPAVAAAATDLLTPEDLPRALERITALAKRGEVAAAARAAAGIGAHTPTTTDLVLAEPIPVELDVRPEPEPEPPDAEVVEEHEIEVVAEEFFDTGGSLSAFASALTEWTPPTIAPDDLEDVEVAPEPVLEESFEGGLSLHDLEATLAEDEPAEDEVLEEADVGMSLEEFEASLKQERDDE